MPAVVGGVETEKRGVAQTAEALDMEALDMEAKALDMEALDMEAETLDMEAEPLDMKAEALYSQPALAQTVEALRSLVEAERPVRSNPSGAAEADSRNLAADMQRQNNQMGEGNQPGRARRADCTRR
jgi:hypothetical protein